MWLLLLRWCVASDHADSVVEVARDLFAVAGILSPARAVKFDEGSDGRHCEIGEAISVACGAPRID